MEHELFVKQAVALARRASDKGEVPVGAVVVSEDGKIIGRGYNQTHKSKNALRHAELIAIAQAQRVLGDWRLGSCDLYVTLEPCLMCLGAIGNTRVRNVYYLLADPLFGSVESKLTKQQLAKIYPNLKVAKLAGGEMVQQIMGEFFTVLRQRTKQDRIN